MNVTPAEAIQTALASAETLEQYAAVIRGVDFQLGIARAELYQLLQNGGMPCPDITAIMEKTKVG